MTTTRSKPLTNTELASYTGKGVTNFLTEIDRQRNYVLRVALTPAPCPMCNNPIDQIEASGRPLDEFDVDGANDPPFRCPHCQTELKATVPFVTSGPAKYQWHRKTPLGRTYSAETRTYTRPGDGALIEVRRAFGRPSILDLESRRLKPDGTPHDDAWHAVTDEQLSNMNCRQGDAARAVLEFFARMADPTP